jgi:hypothetical protein
MQAYQGIRGAYNEGVKLGLQEQELKLRNQQETRLSANQKMENMTKQAENILKFNYSPRSQDITTQYKTGKTTLEEANKRKRDLSDEIYTQNPFMEEVIPGGRIHESITPEGLTAIKQQITGDRAAKAGLDPTKTYELEDTLFEGKSIGNKKITEMTPSPKDFLSAASKLGEKGDDFSAANVTTMFAKFMEMYPSTEEAIKITLDTVKQFNPKTKWTGEYISEVSKNSIFTDPTDNKTYPIINRNGIDYVKVGRNLIPLDQAIKAAENAKKNTPNEASTSNKEESSNNKKEDSYFDTITKNIILNKTKGNKMLTDAAKSVIGVGNPDR